MKGNIGEDENKSLMLSEGCAFNYRSQRGEGTEGRIANREKNKKKGAHTSKRIRPFGISNEVCELQPSLSLSFSLSLSLSRRNLIKS